MAEKISERERIIEPDSVLHGKLKRAFLRTLYVNRLTQVDLEKFMGMKKCEIYKGLMRGRTMAFWQRIHEGLMKLIEGRAA